MPLNNLRRQQALDRLTKLHPKLIDLGLERTLALSQKMGAPHLHLPPTIHIAGTNGKGSTAAILRSMLEAHGYSVHVYASPHLCRFNERIRLNGTLISDDHLADILERIEAVNGGSPVTFFESTTIAAFTAFAEQDADFLILETGLGGKYDSTNIIERHACSIITPVARDHEHFLGTELADIAEQKAGIFKPACPSVWAAQDKAVADRLSHCANIEDIGNILVEGQDFSARPVSQDEFMLSIGDSEITLPMPALFGSHQLQNAALAYGCMIQLGLSPEHKATANGLKNAYWPARVQKLETGNLLRLAGISEMWLDGAHNAHGAAALAEAMRALSDNRWAVIYGALDTRPAEQFLSHISPLTDKVYCLTIPGSDAAIPADNLCQTAASMGIEAVSCQHIEEVMQKIAQDNAGADRAVLACGSLYLAGHLLEKNDTLPD